LKTIVEVTSNGAIGLLFGWGACCS